MSTAITLVEPTSEEDIRSNALTLSERIAALTITDQASFDEASILLKAIKQGRKSVEAFFSDMKKKAHETWRSVCTRESECDKPLAENEKKLSGRMDTYVAEERRRQEEIARQLEAEAKARAEADRVDEAADMVAHGASEAEALAILDEPVVAPTVTVTAPKANGLSIAQRWKARVDSKAKLVAWVAKNPQYLHLLDVNTANLNRLAVAMKSEMRIEGVTAFAENQFRDKK